MVEQIQSRPHTSTTPDHRCAAPEAGRAEKVRVRRSLVLISVLGLVLVLAAVAVMRIVRLDLPVVWVGAIVIDQLAGLVGLKPGLADDVSPAESSTVWLIRAPRVLLTILVGAALAVSGAVLQSLFRTPLVSPDVIGVSSAAPFGGVLTLLFVLCSPALVSGAFSAGRAAALPARARGVS